MDPGRPKIPISTEMPTPSQSGLVVRSHSVQLTKLNTELTTAFAQVTGEMGALRASSASTSTTVSSLSSQVTALTDLVTSLFPARVPEPSPSPPAVPPAAPTEPPLDPRWEPSLPPPKPFAGEFDRCRGFLGQCELLFCHQASRFRSDGARVTLIMSSLTDRALDWAVAAVGREPRMSTNLPLFLEEFQRVFDHPTAGADVAGYLHSIRQGGRGIADYTLEFRTLAADLRYRPPQCIPARSLRGNQGPPRERPSHLPQRPGIPGSSNGQEASRTAPGASPAVHERSPNAVGPPWDQPQQTPGPNLCSSLHLGRGQRKQIW